MTFTNRSRNLILWLILVLLFSLPGTSFLFGQTKQLLTWQQDLNYLQNLPDSDLEGEKDLVTQIRTGLEFWLQLHPQSTVELPAVPSGVLNTEQARDEITLLKETVIELLNQGSLRPFELGVTEISVTAELSPLSPVADNIDNEKTEIRRATDVVEALEYLPGISLDFKPSRNQSGVMIRGFDTRQVGLYLDNIPVYVPYDGYADVGRFLSRRVAEIQVAKGYSSPLLGPNGLGGAVNIVTRQPEKKLEGDILMGTGSGDMIEAGIHMGSRLNNFIIQGGFDWLETDYYPVSGNFNMDADYYGTQTSYNRTNSYQRDADYDARFGYLPNERDQYIFSFMGQSAEYGTPPYSGWNNENNSSIKYWQWDYWERESYYFSSNKGLGENNDIQFRVFYDRYPNKLNVFLDPDPDEGIEPYSELDSYSKYDDYSAGFSSQFTTRVLNRNALSASFFFKDDTHKEGDVEFNDGIPEAIPARTHRDQQISIGLQDSISITGRIHAILGFSMENIDGIKAQDLLNNEILPFECAGESGAASFSACINEWAFNPLASISFSVSKSGTLFFTFAKKSHFPTMKDRYSYKNNRAIPNPTLKPENTRNWSLGYSHVLPFRSMFQVELFRSDVYDAIARAYVPEPSPNFCRRSDLRGYCEQSVNVGKELHHGVEITLRSDLHPRASLDLQYSYLSRSISGPEEMPPVWPTGTPKHKTVGTANIRLPHEISLMATARYESGNIGDYFIDEYGYANPIPASNFATADLGGLIPLFGGARAQVGVKNIFDRNYYYREGYPMAGRNWYFNMKYEF